MFDAVLDKATEKCGSSKALAIELEKSPSEITKFRMGDAGFKLRDIEKLLELSGLEITTKAERDNLINAAMTFAELYKQKTT